MRDRTVDISRKVEVRGGTLRVAGSSRSIALGVEPVTIGRDPACTVVLDDRKVSAIHLELVATARGVLLLDKASRNGTFVGGVRLVEAYLTDDARISVGDTTLVFEPANAERLALGRERSFGPLVGASPSMRIFFDRLSRAASTGLTVLVTGETGTGKELAAHALHDASVRRRGPFVVVDCGAIPAGLAESQLFGHERGAFTGASERRRSPFVEASGGTIFLDEIGELPLDLQPKLLRVLAERRVKAVGASAYEPVDVRVVAATRRDLAGAVNAGSFRSDLFFRLAELRIELPSLRDRVEDIPLLLQAIFTELGDPHATKRVPEHAFERLFRYAWPGNVRELKSAASAALALAEPSGPVDPSAYLGALGIGGDGSAALEALPYHDARRFVLDRFEQAYFARHVADTEGNLAEVARRTGLERAHVRKYVRRHELLPKRAAAGGKKRWSS